MFASEVEFAIARHVRRVVLVANNPELPRTVLGDLRIEATDMVVQFNDAMHEAVLGKLPCRHLRLFRAADNRNFNAGFPPSRATVDAALAAPERHFLVLTRHIPALTRGGVAIADLVLPAVLARCLSVFDERMDYGDLPRYPRPQFVPYADPSTGFWAVAALLDLRRRLCEAGQDGFDIVLAGFGVATTGVFWEGHAWDYERGWLARQLGHGLTMLTGAQAPPARAAGRGQRADANADAATEVRRAA